MSVNLYVKLNKYNKRQKMEKILGKIKNYKTYILPSSLTLFL